jgi:tetratricopeptide (TPR) repeat protein
MSMTMGRGWVAWILAGAVAACGSNGANGGAKAPTAASLRDDARGSSNGELVGRWLLSEMYAPGGDAKEADNARKRLASIGHDGMWAGFARGLDAEVHGAPGAAADAYVTSLLAARTSDDPATPLVAWFASHHLLGLRGAVSELYEKHKPALDGLVQDPRKLGWRAATELVEWSIAEAFDKADVTGDAYDALVRKRSGCSGSVMLAGPFGHGSEEDRARSFDAERPGPWPPAWPKDPLRGSTPHLLKVDQPRCLASGMERTEGGVFYAQTFFETKNERDLLVAVSGAVKVWVDDAPVLERSLDDWGSWERFGVAVHVGAGRHRVVARLLGDTSTARLLNLDGTPADVSTDANQRAPYGIAPPRVLADPNPIDAAVRAQKAGDPIEAALAGFLAHVEGLDDVASVLVDPIVQRDDAPGPALEQAAMFAGSDPAMPDDLRARNQKELYKRALARDPALWYAPAWLTLDEGEQKGFVESVVPLRKLADQFPNEPEVHEQLARVYEKLGWLGERMRALADLAARFPDDLSALRLALTALDEQGPLTEADRVAGRIKKLDPDAEVDLDRALERHDWKAAIAELERLQKRRPDRKEIAVRIGEVLARGGDPSASFAQLAKALAKDPRDADARFKMADHAFAKGDEAALRKALADALATGAKASDLRDAIDLLEGATYLEPWRLDGKKQIREFEAWEKKGHQMEGTAARVLDYSALWVHPDGSSDMLEHEILRIQSQEEIGRESEQNPPSGLILRLRVLKPDGTQLEPEPVAGKPTMTMPHLEVGDYIEIEHITPDAGDGSKGRTYRGPAWFFREADKGYWRSQFVVIAPKDKKLDIETRGNVPAPKERDVGPTYRERRWLVEDSPPAPEEPESAPAQEWLPSVRIGWGVTLADTVARFVDMAQDLTPLDPRLRVRALEIVGNTTDSEGGNAGVLSARRPPESNREERAKRAYAWVVEHVEDGNEKDPRKIVLGRSGSKQSAYLYLMRLLGIPLDLAIVRDRLAMPPAGPMSDVDDYDSVALRLDLGGGKKQWLTVHDKFAPFGYVPVQQRGQPCIVLVAGTPKDTVTASGATDGIAYEGRADLREDGSAAVDLTERFDGNAGIQMRNVFDRVAEAQVHDFVEQRLVGPKLPGARLRDLKLENEKNLGAPLLVHMHLEVPSIARAQGNEMVLEPLFAVHLAHLATLPQRQTPLFLSSWAHVEVKFEVVAPLAMRMPPSLPKGEAKDGERIVKVDDAVNGHAITLARLVDIPAGRVQPNEYARFQKFTADADALLEREIALGR